MPNDDDNAVLVPTLFVATAEPLLAPLLFLAADALVALTSGRRASSASRAAAKASSAAVALRREAKALSTPATFASAAKLERRAMALERDAERFTAAAEAETSSKSSKTLKVASALKAGIFLLLLVRWWGRPVAVLRPRESVWPLARWLAQPHGGGGGIFGGALSSLFSSRQNRKNTAALFGGGGGDKSAASVFYDPTSFAGIAVLPWLAASKIASAAVARAVFGKAALA